MEGLELDGGGDGGAVETNQRSLRRLLDLSLGSGGGGSAGRRVGVYPEKTLKTDGPRWEFDFAHTQ